MQLWSIHSCLQRYKNYKIPPRHVRVIVENKVAPFTGHGVYIGVFGSLTRLHVDTIQMSSSSTEHIDLTDWLSDVQLYALADHHHRTPTTSWPPRAWARVVVPSHAWWPRHTAGQQKNEIMFLLSPTTCRQFCMAVKFGFSQYASR